MQHVTSLYGKKINNNNSIPAKTMTTSIKLTTLTNSDEVHRIAGSLMQPL